MSILLIFKPYVQILQALGIPWCLITDGDFYEAETKTVDSKEKKFKHYHRIHQEGEEENFRGHELMIKMLIDLGYVSESEVPEDDFSEQEELLKRYGCFVGYYTLEVDMLDIADETGIEIFKTVYSEVRPGGRKQQKNFDNDLDSGNFWDVLKKIDDNVSKGRFAQRFVSHLIIDLVPEYIKEAIHDIIDKVTSAHE